VLFAPVSVLSAAEITLAQNFLGPPQPGRERVLPEAPPAELDFTIQAPRRTPVPRAAEELSFEAKDVQVVGVTAYPPDDIRPLIAPVIGKTIHLSDLVAAAERIEAKYRADGYILSRAYVPAQSVSNGVFQIAVVEGYIAATSVVGGDETTRSRIERLVAPVLASRPLQMSVIEQALLTANDTPGVNVSGLLRPSATEAGVSDLVVTVSSQPYTILLSTDNRGAKSSGVWTESVDVAVRSPFPDGGQILLNASAAPDVNQRRSMQGKYVFALGGATLSMSGLVSHGQPAGSVSDLRLVSNGITVGPHVSYPLILSRQERLSLDGGFTWQAADVHVLGAPFSHDEWRVVDAALVYQNSRWLDGVSNATLDVAKGVNLFGASKPGSIDLSRPGGRPDFTKASTQLRRVQTLDGPLSLSASASGQYSLDKLLTGEEISFGGAQIGRGYDPATVTGDHGAGGAFELRYDLDAADLYLDQAQLYTFYDIGRVWLRSGKVTESELQSIGLGVRMVVFTDLSLAAELAHGLLPLATSDNGRRDTRVLFNGSVKF
jgi:hemolysin activation/secretion protein